MGGWGREREREGEREGMTERGRPGRSAVVKGRYTL